MLESNYIFAKTRLRRNCLPARKQSIPQAKMTIIWNVFLEKNKKEKKEKINQGQEYKCPSGCDPAIEVKGSCRAVWPKGALFKLR